MIFELALSQFLNSFCLATDRFVIFRYNGCNYVDEMFVTYCLLSSFAVTRFFAHKYKHCYVFDRKLKRILTCKRFIDLQRMVY